MSTPDVVQHCGEYCEVQTLTRKTYFGRLLRLSQEFFRLLGDPRSERPSVILSAGEIAIISPIRTPHY